MPGAATGHLPTAVCTASFGSTLPLNTLSCWELPLSSGSLFCLSLYPLPSALCLDFRAAGFGALAQTPSHGRNQTELGANSTSTL